MSRWKERSHQQGLTFGFQQVLAHPQSSRGGHKGERKKGGCEQNTFHPFVNFFLKKAYNSFSKDIKLTHKELWGIGHRGRWGHRMNTIKTHCIHYNFVEIFCKIMGSGGEHMEGLNSYWWKFCKFIGSSKLRKSIGWYTPSIINISILYVIN